MVGAGLVVLAYKGGADFFVGYIDRGLIINTHPLGKRKNGRVRLCMYRYISHGHDLYPQDPASVFQNFGVISTSNYYSDSRILLKSNYLVYNSVNILSTLLSTIYLNRVSIILYIIILYKRRKKNEWEGVPEKGVGVHRNRLLKKSKKRI